MAIVIAAVQQRLMGHDQQRTVLVHGCGNRLKVLNGFLDLSIAIESNIAGIGGGIHHAQGIDIVIAVVSGTHNAVIAGTIDHAAGLVQSLVAGFVIDSSAIMVRPDVVHFYIHIFTQSVLDVTGDGIGIAAIINALIHRECVAAAGNGGNGQTGCLQLSHHLGDLGLLVALVTGRAVTIIHGMQVSENDRCIHGILGPFAQVKGTCLEFLRNGFLSGFGHSGLSGLGNGFLGYRDGLLSHGNGFLGHGHSSLGGLGSSLLGHGHSSLGSLGDSLLTGLARLLRLTGLLRLFGLLGSLGLLRLFRSLRFLGLFFLAGTLGTLSLARFFRLRLFCSLGCRSFSSRLSRRFGSRFRCYGSSRMIFLFRCKRTDRQTAGGQNEAQNQRDHSLQHRVHFYTSVFSNSFLHHYYRRIGTLIMILI